VDFTGRVKEESKYCPDPSGMEKQVPEKVLAVKNIGFLDTYGHSHQMVDIFRFFCNFLPS
jgi:hypothetical protein